MKVVILAGGFGSRLGEETIIPQEIRTTKSENLFLKS